MYENIDSIINWEHFTGVDRTAEGKHNVTFNSRYPVQVHAFKLDITQQITPNFHDYLEIAHILHGSGWADIGGRQIELKKGDLVYIGPFDLHTFWSDPDNPAHFIVAWFLPEYIGTEDPGKIDYAFFTPFLTDLPDRMIKPKVKQRERIITNLRTIYTLECKQPENFRLYQKVKLLDLMIAIKEATADQAGTEHRKLSPLNRFASLFSYVHSNFKEHISIDRAAQQACMSKFHFCRAFKAATGSSFTAYVNKHRVDRAKNLLQDTDYPITHIAGEAGFRNLSHFNDKFKMYMRMTPREYRKKSRSCGN